MQKVVFLDRDDTICVDGPYCSRPEDLVLVEGAGKAISKLNRNNFLVIVITNQSGISRGFFSHEVLASIHSKMCSDLLLSGAKIDDIFYCPCLPEVGCADRKPGIGLFEKSSDKYDIDIQNSYMVGDRKSDVVAGQRFGLTTVLIGKEEERDSEDFFASDINQAIDWIIDNT